MFDDAGVKLALVGLLFGLGFWTAEVVVHYVRDLFRGRGE